MDISSLSDSTRKHLGSSSDIASPVALVKELLDNAIDAQATAVEVLISPNTIDKIEVRDNGVGIHPDDYDSLGRGGHTSKLNNFEELMTVAGSTLGFRGEALASMNVMAKMTITTKTSSDPMAAVLQIVPKSGGVLEQRGISAPIGTTVTVTGLFSEMPVREQLMSKESSKTLDRMKELLRSYAMARPQLKLTFKVLKTPKLNWTYAPKQEAGVREAALELFGVDFAAQCVEKTREMGTLVGQSMIQEGQQALLRQSFVFAAFMLKPDAISPQIPKHHYISIDGRPISRSKGIKKRLVEIYWKYLRSALGNRATTISITDVFIRLNIKCPVGSYDANIEPYTNDVLFEDEAVLLNHFQTFCEELYGPLQISASSTADRPQTGLEDNKLLKGNKTAPATSPSGSPMPEVRPENRDQQTLTEHSLQTESTPQQVETGEKPSQQSSSEQPNGLQERQTRRRRSTSGQVPWNTSHSTRTQDPGNNSQMNVDRSQHHNKPFKMPRWTSDMSIDLSEVTGNLRSKKRLKPSRPMTQQQTSFDEVENPAELPLNPWSIARINADVGRQEPLELLTQRECLASQEPAMTPEPALLRHPGAPPRDLDLPPSLRCHNISSEENVVPNVVPGGMFRSPVSSPMGVSPQRTSLSQKGTTSMRRRAQPPWTTPASINEEQAEWQNMYNFRRQPAPDGLEQTTLSFGTSKNSRNARGNKAPAHEQLRIFHDGDSPTTDEVYPGNPSARRNIAQQFKLGPSALQSPPLSQQPFSRPPHNMQTHMKTLEDREPIKTFLPAGDPRAYLLRRQKSTAAEEQAGKPKKLRRMKSSLMALENAPSDELTNHLLLPVELDMVNLSEDMKLAEPYDQYVVEGNIEEGLDMDLDEGCKIEERLNVLLTRWNEELTGEHVEAECRLSALLKGKSVVTRA